MLQNQTAITIKQKKLYLIYVKGKAFPSQAYGAQRVLEVKAHNLHRCVSIIFKMHIIFKVGRLVQPV
jgi:hypothetical protein